MNRLLALLLFLSLLPIYLLVYLAIKLTDWGPSLHWSKRVGRNNKLFLMPKFRTMSVNSPNVATHLLQNSESYLTPIGGILRKTSLDELPQLYSIARGDMNFVGPRPALFNQEDLIGLRDKYGVSVLKPGVTGWAQINGRDSILIPEKVSLDAYYLKNQSFLLDFKILIGTFIKLTGDKDVSH